MAGDDGWIDLVVHDVGDLRRSRMAVAELANGGSFSVDDAVLAACELVTNALAYTNGPCRVLGRRTRHGRRLRVEVVDSSPTALPAVPRAEPDALRGRGLSIVDQLASQWGVRIHDGIGKTVWFELDAPA